MWRIATLARSAQVHPGTERLSVHGIEAAGQRAAAGRTLQALANNVLKRSLHTPVREPFALTLQGWAADLQPGVDLFDRNALFDVQSGR